MEDNNTLHAYLIANENKKWALNESDVIPLFMLIAS